MIFYELNVIAYDHILGCECEPTFKFELKKVEISFKKLLFITDDPWYYIVFSIESNDFWEGYNKFKKFVEDNNIPKDDIEYPDICKYIKI